MAFLDELWVALQPIVSLKTGTVLGHESLIRGPIGSGWEPPDKIFAMAIAARPDIRVNTIAYHEGQNWTVL